VLTPTNLAFTLLVHLRVRAVKLQGY
jgi:hypothetical protein